MLGVTEASNIAISAGQPLFIEAFLLVHLGQHHGSGLIPYGEIAKGQIIVPTYKWGLCLDTRIRPTSPPGNRGPGSRPAEPDYLGHVSQGPLGRSGGD